jgi:hypothetical protein
LTPPGGSRYMFGDFMVVSPPGNEHFDTFDTFHAKMTPTGRNDPQGGVAIFMSKRVPKHSLGGVAKWCPGTPFGWWQTIGQGGWQKCVKKSFFGHFFGVGDPVEIKYCQGIYFYFVGFLTLKRRWPHSQPYPFYNVTYFTIKSFFHSHHYWF